jgi:hypothetical protein
MTNREFYTNIANGTVTEAEIAFASAAIEKMDAANEKRKNKPSKTAIENAPVIEAITGVLTNDPQTAADIGVQVGVSTAKASSLLRQIVLAGNAVATDIKVPKKGTCKGYSLPVAE